MVLFLVCLTCINALSETTSLQFSIGEQHSALGPEEEPTLGNSFFIFSLVFQM